jgi:RHS repeat-associated protein
MLTKYYTETGTDAPEMYFRYDPYGATNAYYPGGTAVPAGVAYDTDRLYTGQRWDSTTLFYDYGARFYDPRIAHFLSQDPAGEYMNPYAYVAWNPVMRTDPSGMFAGLDSELGAVSAGIAFMSSIEGLAWAWLLAYRGLVGGGAGGTKAAGSGGNGAGFLSSSSAAQATAIALALAKIAGESVGSTFQDALAQAAPASPWTSISSLAVRSVSNSLAVRD